MRHIFALFIAIAIVFVGIGPSGLAAQTDDDPLGWGEGIAADAATTAAVQSFLEEFTAAVNVGDGSAANLFTLEFLLESHESYEGGVAYFSSGFVSPMTLFDVETVFMYPEGGLSADVMFQGLIFPGAYYTYRYFFIETPHGYAVHHLQRQEPRLAEGMTGVSVDVILSDASLTVSESDVASVDVVFLEVQNTNTQEPLSTGVHVLPDGLTGSDAQAQLAADLYTFDWLGGTPTAPSSERTYAFVVEPGTTYFIQQFADGGDSRFAVLLTGEAFVTTITVGTEEPED